MAMMDWKLVRQKRTKVCFVQKQSEPLFAGAVSYTHLTLPTT